MTELGRLFNPRSIAVIGASTDTRKIRGRVLANVIHAGFKGEVYPVNPSSTEIQGLKAYPSVSALPAGIDLAIIALSAGQVVEALEQCAAAGVGSAIVFASGFAEGGDAAGQQRITDLALRSGMRILGPNTVGFDNEDLGVAATFSPITTERLKASGAPGDRNSAIDIVCQSGGLGFALASRATAKGIHVRYTITTGNEADCETLEIIEHLLLEAGSRAILLFVEGFRNPERLERIAMLAAQRAVPLLIAKMGRSAAGQRAAVSHTAHLTGSDVICDAVFERHGVIRVADPEEMMAMAAALTRLSFITGNRVAIITTSGGTGGWAADILSAEGLSIPEPSAMLKTRLEELMPGFGSAANPIDVTASVVEDGGIGLAKVIGAVAASREYDAALVILSLVAPGRIATMRALLEPILDSGEMPIIFHSPGIPCQDNADHLQQLKAVHLSLRDAGAAFRGLARYGDFQRRYKAFAPPENDKGAAPARPARDASTILSTKGADRSQIRAMLERYGVVTPPEATVKSALHAVDAAERIGFPLAMKIESADIPHKSDAGCVVLGVQDRAACAAAYERIMENAWKFAGAARVDGVLLQKMMPPGIEMVVGMITDPDFGPMIMLGFGGIYVEILRDSVVAPCPISRDEAYRMVGSLKGSDILKGARGQKPADIAALVETLVGISRLVLDAGGAIAEADFNPVIVYPEGQGASVVDYLFVPQGSRA